MAAANPAGAAGRYRVRHVTRYRYLDSAVLAHHLLHLEPRSLPRQRNAGWRLTIEPEPAGVARHVDCFGNPATYLSIEMPHVALSVVSELKVELILPPTTNLAATPAWEDIGAPPDVVREAAG